MEKSFFKTGKVYAIRKKDWESPFGEIIKGDFFIKKILEGANKTNSRPDATDMELENWSQFLRVEGENGNIHLLHPETIQTAYLIEAK